MRRLPIERENGAVEWVEVADGDPAPYPTMNESDEPVDDRLARIYHCDRWATAAAQCVELDRQNDRLWALLEKGAKLLRTVYGSKDAFAHRAKEWLDEIDAETRAALTNNRHDGSDRQKGR